MTQVRVLSVLIVAGMLCLPALAADTTGSQTRDTDSQPDPASAVQPSPTCPSLESVQEAACIAVKISQLDTQIGFLHQEHQDLTSNMFAVVTTVLAVAALLAGSGVGYSLFNAWQLRAKSEALFHDIERVKQQYESELQQAKVVADREFRVMADRTVRVSRLRSLLQAGDVSNPAFYADFRQLANQPTIDALDVFEAIRSSDLFEEDTEVKQLAMKAIAALDNARPTQPD